MRRCFVLLFFIGFPLLAQQHPDYTGTWALVPDESDFAGKDAPEAKTETIQQTDGSVTENVHEMEGDGSARNGTMRYTIGQQSSNDAFGQQWTSHAKWDGQDLSIHTESTGKGSKAGFDDHWTLSLDGSRLTVRRHYEGEGIRYDQMLIYHRQEPDK